jgi:hypothetical protein
MRSHFVAQTGLKLKILLIQPPECPYYRCAPPYPIDIRPLRRLIEVIKWSPNLIGLVSFQEKKDIRALRLSMCTE